MAIFTKWHISRVLVDYQLPRASPMVVQFLLVWPIVLLSEVELPSVISDSSGRRIGQVTFVGKDSPTANKRGGNVSFSLQESCYNTTIHIAGP